MRAPPAFDVESAITALHHVALMPKITTLPMLALCRFSPMYDYAAFITPLR